VRICLRRWPNLRHRAREWTVRKSRDGERNFVAELDIADVLGADNGVDVSEGEICGDDEERYREFAGFTGLVFKAIRGREGFTRDFGCGRYENLSGAISWLTFFAGGAADVRRSRNDWRRELAESTICSQRKPRPSL
jgi:hypothetical protein